MSVWSLNVKYIRKLVRFISCQIYGVNFDVLLLLCHPVPYQQYHMFPQRLILGLFVRRSLQSIFKLFPLPVLDITGVIVPQFWSF